MSKLRCWHFSDSHNSHWLLDVPKDIDMIIFSGDCSNYRDVARNSVEVEDFLWWYNSLNVKYKIMIAGNHDGAIASGFISKDKIESQGIIYLYNEAIEVAGLKLYGSPITPSYGDWSFMRKRGKLAPLWETIPENLDILITHGPPKGVLDLSESVEGKLEQVGDKELWNEIVKKKPRYSLSGHIHNCGNIINAGVLKLSEYPTIFSNGSVVTDGKFGMISSNGNILDI